jgi:hypothetical protein
MPAPVTLIDTTQSRASFTPASPSQRKPDANAPAYVGNDAMRAVVAESHCITPHTLVGAARAQRSLGDLVRVCAAEDFIDVGYSATSTTIVYHQFG